VSGPARTEALRLADGAPVLAGVLIGVLVGGMHLLVYGLRGDPRPMTIPLTGVSIVIHKGRVFVLRAAFDGAPHPGDWTLLARSRDRDGIWPSNRRQVTSGEQAVRAGSRLEWPAPSCGATAVLSPHGAPIVRHKGRAYL